MDMMLTFAQIMPIDILVEMLEESVSAYKIDSSKENESKLASMCALIAMKGLVDKEGLSKIQQEMELYKNIGKHFKSEN